MCIHIEPSGKQYSIQHFSSLIEFVEVYDGVRAGFDVHKSQNGKRIKRAQHLIQEMNQLSFNCEGAPAKSVCITSLNGISFQVLHYAELSFEDDSNRVLPTGFDKKKKSMIAIDRD